MESKNLQQDGAPCVTRRSFVAAAATAAAAVAATGSLSGCSPKEVDDRSDIVGTGADPFADCSTVYGCCSMECQHHSLKGYVRDGKLVKVEAGETNECGICPRGIARTEMVNSDERLTKPLKLVGEKGSGEFEEIEWDEAIDMLESHIRSAIETDGSKSIAYNVYSGNFSNLSANVWGSFFSWMGDGCTQLSDNTCCAAITSAMTPIFGKRNQVIRDQFDKSDCVIFWGNNPAITLGGYFGRFEAVKKNGGTLCTIDPYYSESADKSQEWLQVYPSSDLALGLYMLNVIISEGLTDEDYLKAHTTAPCLVDVASDSLVLADAANETSYQVIDAATGQFAAHDAGVAPLLSAKGTAFEGAYATVYDLIAEKAAEVDDAVVELECGIDAEDARRVARDYASAEHAMIIENMGGYQRTEFGSWATAVQLYLALFTGNVGHEGDGVYDAGGINNLVAAGKPFEVNPNTTKAGALHKTHFGEQIEAGEPYKINMFLEACENLASQAPNANKVKEGLKNIPFVVTVDMFMSSTALYSDLVLPVTAVFETENVTASSRSNIISLSEAGVTPPGEAKSDLEIVRELAKRFGIEDKYSQEPSYYIGKVLAPYGITYDELKEKKAIDMRDADYIAFKDGNFLTKSGKAELFVPAWKKEGFPPIPEFRRTQESILNAGAYPLAAVQRKSYRTIHTTFSQLKSLQNMFDTVPPIVINSEDAAARGISNGDTVTAFNDRGEHTGVAQVTDLVKKGVVVLQNGWQDGIGSTTSNVTNNAFPTLGTVHTCNSTLIDVRKGA